MRHYLAAKHNEDGLRTPNEKSLNPFVPNAAFLYPFYDVFRGYRKGTFVTNALTVTLEKLFVFSRRYPVIFLID